VHCAEEEEEEKEEEEEERASEAAASSLRASFKWDSLISVEREDFWRVPESPPMGKKRGIFSTIMQGAAATASVL